MTHLVVLSVILSLSSSVSLQAAQLNQSQSEYVLKIGTMALAPYGWIDKNNTKHGIIYELNQEIGLRLDTPFTNEIYPFKRMLKMLDSGELDLVSSQAHQEAIDSGEQLGIQHDIVVIAGTKKGSNIQSIKDLKGKSLIYHLSSSYIELEEISHSITRTNNYKQSVKSLYKSKYFDAAIFSEPAYYYWIKELGLTSKDFGNVVVISPKKKQWIFVRRDLPDKIKNDVKLIVEDIYKENLYKDLLFKYGKAPQVTD
jgi:ABC-type amino acid transport substrate-binding protein